MRITPDTKFKHFLCAFSIIAGVSLPIRAPAQVSRIVSEWSDDATKREEWKDLERRYQIVGAPGGPLPVPTPEGAVLHVVGWTPGRAGDLSNVYYSGSAPHKNEPAETALQRRTILDVLWGAKPGGRERAVALTYGWKIKNLLSLAAGSTVDAESERNNRVLQLIREAQASFSVDLGTYFRWGFRWDSRRNTFCTLDGRNLNETEALDALLAASGEWEKTVTRDENHLKKDLKEYRHLVGLPRGQFKDYATHCEIMFLYEAWSQLGCTDRRVPGNCLLYELDKVLARVAPQEGPTLLISKPMCENCEFWVVRSWTGGDRPLTVVSEGNPKRAAERKMEVKKVDCPLNGRPPYIPTP